MTATDALVATAERQLSAPLALLVAAVLDGDYDQATRDRLNGAANHISCALNRLARIQTPARECREHPESLLGDTARGPVLPPAATGERRASGSVSVFCGAIGESDRSVVEAIADAPNPPAPAGGRAGGGGPIAPGTVRGFSLPEPPRFRMRESERRLIGRVDFATGGAVYRGAQT